MLALTASCEASLLMAIPLEPSSLHRSHDNLHDMRRLQLDADAGPHRRIGLVDPFVPGAVHLALPRHVIDINDGLQDLAFVGATQREALIDAGKGFDALLVH